MNISKYLFWLFFALIYFVSPFLVIKYLNISREFIFGIMQIISELGVLLVILFYRESIKKRFCKKEINLLIICFVSAIAADFLYMNNLTDFNKENFIMATIQELFIEDFLFMVFMTTMLIFLYLRMKESFLKSKFSIIFAILAGSLYFFISIKFAIKSHFSPVIQNPDYLQFYSCITISVIESFKVALVAAMSARSNKINDFLFLQAILLLCFSELGISYTEIIVVDHLYGTSPFEAGWFIGILSFFILFLKAKGPPQFNKEDFTDNYSLRTIISISILIGLTLFYFLLGYLKIINVVEVENVLAIILICFLVWFFSNLVAMQFSKVLVNLNLQIIKPDYFLLTPSCPWELDTYREIPSEGIYETKKIIQNYNGLAKEANKMVQKFREQTKIVTLSKIAKQVSHDIKSPLSALSMMSKLYMQELPEEKRIIVRQQIERMQDIINNLLAKSKVNENNVIDKNTYRVELISSVIEEIISEKRINFSTQSGIVIESEIYTEHNYGLFAKINLSDFKRVISNIINNAVEALIDSKGKVFLKLNSSSKYKVEIEIEDNGRGIPSENLAKLGFEGVSFGKEKSNESGNGLGLYHARSILAKWGGTLSIISEVGTGTKVTITLPRSEEPKWFVSKIIFKKNQIIIILDDENGIHKIWENRFKSLLISEYGITLIHLYHPNGFRDWFRENPNEIRHAICLCDYEFRGFNESGLDLLEEYNMKNSILITSHYENEKVRKRCETLEICLIPKMLVGFVPFEVAD